MTLRPGDVIETDTGRLVAVTGCDAWPSSSVPYTATVSTVDDDGEVVFVQRAGDGWKEVWHG